ncbi:MAG: HAD family phosphatase [Acidobacteria bacterium]|nr:HAD family phosphatase [Acidobacteriota bacterium]
MAQFPEPADALNDRREIVAVVFDMDGVIIDSHPVHLAAWKSFLDSVGREVTARELAFIFEGRTRSEILRRFLGDLTDEELVAYGKQKDEIFRQMEHEIDALPGVLDFIHTLARRGVPRAIATSASEIRTLATIERLGLGEHFDTVITASDVTAGKPDPMAYRLACERMGVAPARVLAFDDAPAGIQSARSAGLRCIGVSSNGWARRLLETGAERIIPNFIGLSLASLGRVL